MNVQGWFPLGLTGFDLPYAQATLKSVLHTTIQKHQFTILYVNIPYSTVEQWFLKYIF